MASGSDGDDVQLVDAAGATVASFTVAKSFDSVVFSSADVIEGADYT